MRTDILPAYRFFAASLVVMSHFALNTQLGEVMPWLITSGSEMVTFFFVLSGFIMGLTCLEKNNFAAATYWLNRFSRIYPAYFVAALMMILFFGSKDSANDLKAIVLHLTLLQSWVPGYPMTVNFPAWSLSIEALFYALLPAIIFLLRRKKPDALMFLCACTGFWLLTQVTHLYLLNSPRFGNHQETIKFLVNFFPLSHLCSFMFGIAGYYLFSQHRISLNPEQGNNNLLLNTGLALMIASIIIVLSRKSAIAASVGMSLPFGSSLMSPLFLLLIMISVGCNNSFTRVFSGRYFVMLGEASYAIYILQKPVKLIHSAYIYPFINTTLHISLGKDFHFFMYFVILISFSIWVMNHIEHPAKEFIRKRF